MNPLYLPERQMIRRKQAEWTEAMHMAAARKRMRAYRWRLRRARMKAVVADWIFVNRHFFAFLFHLALWSFIALVFTASILGFRR